VAPRCAPHRPARPLLSHWPAINRHASACIYPQPVPARHDGRAPTPMRGAKPFTWVLFLTCLPNPQPRRPFRQRVSAQPDTGHPSPSTVRPRRAKSSQALMRRYRIVSDCAAGQPNNDVATCPPVLRHTQLGGAGRRTPAGSPTWPPSAPTRSSPPATCRHSPRSPAPPHCNGEPSNSSTSLTACATRRQ
jgi:hypothetical protein